MGEPLLKKKRSDNPHYVSNKQLTAELAEWIAENKNKPNRKSWTQMPDYVATSILKLVEKYSLRSNWHGYTWLDEMKSEALLNCVRYAHNFKIEKSDNAFGYITKLLENSFRQVLSKEKTQAAIKFKSISEQSIHNNDRIILYDEEESH